MCVLDSLPSRKLRNRHGKSIIFIFRCYVRNYRGGSQKNKQTNKQTNNHHFNWCFQKTMNLSNIPKKRPSSTGRNLSSPQTLRWKSGGSTQRNAIGGWHFHLTQVFFGTFFHQVEKIGKPKTWMGVLLWYIWWVEDDLI